MEAPVSDRTIIEEVRPRRTFGLLGTKMRNERVSKLDNAYLMVLSMSSLATSESLASLANAERNIFLLAILSQL